LLRIAIVGLGPWGICALERVVSQARHGLRAGLEVEVHVVEPGTPGSGVYDVAQPDYLLMNNACSQISLYPYASEADQPGYGVGLYEWAVRQGYHWVGEVCAVDRSGSPIEPHHFLPRRLMGEYLQWFYLALVAGAPTGVEIVLHPTMAVDVLERPGRGEEVCLATGTTLIVDHVIVTSGHTANQPDGHGVLDPHQLSPYPVTAYTQGLPSQATVAVAGMGLVALDVVTALSVGRGGRFVGHGDGLRYRPSGREPAIHLFSRSGLPYTAKSVTGSDLTGVYRPAICTPEAFDRLNGRLNGARRQADLRIELLPLLFAEMCVRYYAQRAVSAGTADDGAAVHAQLGGAWSENRFDDELRRLAERFGEFDAEAVFFGHQPRYDSSEDYQRAVYEMLIADIREAEVPDGASPVKSATEVFRIFRDAMRSVVEYGGLSLDSYLEFNADIRSRINRLVAGPPALRSRQLVALIDAGVLRAPYGPAPALGPALGRADPDPARARISSTALHDGHAADVDVVIRGHLEEPRIDGSASILLSHLYERGRVSQFRYGAVSVGSVDLTADAHPIDIDGRPQTRIWMFGVLTEGVRHFTHYIPSPKSRIRAFEDLGACVAEILG
jgi:hypothetical protein